MHGPACSIWANLIPFLPQRCPWPPWGVRRGPGARGRSLRRTRGCWSKTRRRCSTGGARHSAPLCSGPIGVLHSSEGAHCVMASRPSYQALLDAEELYFFDLNVCSASSRARAAFLIRHDVRGVKARPPACAGLPHRPRRHGPHLDRGGAGPGSAGCAGGVEGGYGPLGVARPRQGIATRTFREESPAMCHLHGPPSHSDPGGHPVVSGDRREPGPRAPPRDRARPRWRRRA